MKLKELLGSTSGEFKDLEITSVTCDSRKVIKGSAYICIDGVNVDGHKFVHDAINNGASIIICERDMKIDNQIIVDNTRKWFSVICANWFNKPALSFKVVGVTGTNGKTSTAIMVKTILEAEGYKVGLVGTIQNMVGDKVVKTTTTTPDSYELQSVFAQMRDEGCQYCVMEVSSHALDQSRVYGIDYEVAMFTNLTQDHLDYHKTMENYLNAKKILFSQCKTAIINKDDGAFKELTKGLSCKLKTYSVDDSNSDYFANKINYKSDGIEYNFNCGEFSKQVKMSTGGKFTAYNSMCAVACAIELGIDKNRAIEAISQLSGVKGRAEVVPTGKDFTVIIDYAHTPDGVKNILSTFKDCPKNRLIALFGCGGDRDKTKRPKMGAIAAELADYMIVTSDNPRSEDPEAIIKDILVGVEKYDTPYTVITNRVEAIKYAVKNAQKGDIIVLAGKGHETYQILNDKTIHLDEREVVAEALKEC